MSLLINEIKDILKNIVSENNFLGEVHVEKTKSVDKGHFSSNFPLINSKINKVQPLELGQKIVDKIKNSDFFEKVELAKPGFINFFCKQEKITKVIEKIDNEKESYGRAKNKNYAYNLELVSANPTGYLHIGHARNGVIGDCVARILKFNGYTVTTDYYTNDAGNQINVLACTMYYNYLKLLGIDVEKPDEMYGGDIYSEVAQNFLDEYGDSLKGYEMKNNCISNEEVHNIFREKSIDFFLTEIKKQLNELGVKIDYFSSEKSMYDNNEIQKTLDKYHSLGKTYEKEGALWLKTTEFGDDKDRVLIKKDGFYTYILPDLACHNVRFERVKANKYINYWGGDHHGYIPRMRAGLALLGYDYNILDIEMIQMVRLMKDGQEYKMSKRKGTAVWLVDLLEMIGKDSIRYMLASKAPSTHMDFDLDLAVAKNSSNPVYYAQYATARAYKLLEKGKKLKGPNKKFNLLTDKKEIELLLLLDEFEDQISYAAKKRLPSVVCDYIQSLSKAFHSYYSDSVIFDEENIELSSQRMILVSAVRQVLCNAFRLIDIKPMENM